MERHDVLSKKGLEDFYTCLTVSGCLINFIKVGFQRVARV